MLKQEQLKAHLLPSALIFKAANVVAVCMLISTIYNHPYDYYVVLRFVVSPVMAIGAFQAYALQKPGWLWLLAIMALLFNPIIPVHLTRHTWMPINIFCACLLVAVAFNLNQSINESIKQDNQ